MNHKTAADHFSEAITRLNKHPHPLSPAGEGADDPGAVGDVHSSGEHGFSICFSREAGSGGITVAKEVGRRLNWPVYDQELLEHLAKDLKVDVSLVQDYDERRGSWLVDCIKAFSATASVSEVTYFRRLVRLLQALGARGECLIVGRGSSFILPRETTLRVRIVASRDDRTFRPGPRPPSMALPQLIWTRTFRVNSILLDSETIHECQEASQDLWRPSCLAQASRLDEMVQRGFNGSGADWRHQIAYGPLGKSMIQPS